MNSPARIACEYGAPWNGAGAFSVRITDFISVAIGLLSSAGTAALRQRDAERLEDRLQHMLGVPALDQADVERQAGSFGELREKPGDEIGRETADTHVREIDVGNEQRPARGLEHDMRQRLVGGEGRRAVATPAPRMESFPRRSTPRPAGRRHL